MFLRKAESRDLKAIDKIFADGRRFLHEQGLPQWQNGYGPTAEDAEKDIARGEGFVFVEGETVFAYAVLIVAIDNAYENIRDGAWKSLPNAVNPRYASVHRVVFAKEVRGKGLAKIFLKGLISEAGRNGFRDVRIDTHEGNSIMRHVIEEAGFVYRGIVEFPIPFGERMAYQIISDGG